MCLRKEWIIDRLQNRSSGETLTASKPASNQMIGTRFVMKILLQHNRTLQYLRPNNTWARHASDGRNFQNSQTAINYAYENNLLDVYIAVKFIGDESDDVVVPLPERTQSVAEAAVVTL
jgi:hypothetical protein